MAFRVLEWESGCDMALSAPETQAALLRRMRRDLGSMCISVSHCLEGSVDLKCF